MSFYTEYELQEPVPGGTVKSFKARQIATQRDVRVHLLVGGNDSVMRHMRTLPPEKRSLILDQGVNGGNIYIVTPPLPGDLGFEHWLSAAPVATPPATPSAGPGEVTPMFHSLASPTPTQPMPAAPSASPG